MTHVYTRERHENKNTRVSGLPMVRQALIKILVDSANAKIKLIFQTTIFLDFKPKLRKEVENNKGSEYSRRFPKFHGDIPRILHTPPGEGG